MRCVIVTGAGASRELGKDRRLPLMEDWAAALRAELDGREKGLARALGLRAGMSGEEFEATLGSLFRWRDLRPLNERFRDLGGKQIGRLPQAVVEAHVLETARFREIVAGINCTLFQMFSAAAIDEGRAVDAYKTLLETLGNPDDLMVVTTNYDPACEIGLSGLGRHVDTGFDRPPGRPPTLNPQGLVERSRGRNGSVGVVHLHGAVGWYEQDGTVHERHQDQPFDSNHGRPVVLYPDPEKDPTRDALVQALWDEFDAALAEASHVLVIGHSLHDPALVAKLRSIERPSRIAVCVYDGSIKRARKSEAPPQTGLAEVRRARSQLPNADILSIRFGPRQARSLDSASPWFNSVGEWCERTRRARR